jgi:hypothetical protein
MFPIVVTNYASRQGRFKKEYQASRAIKIFHLFGIEEEVTVLLNDIIFKAGFFI